MKLTILGSGTCVPYVKRGSSGYVIETDNSKLLLDCGSGSTWKLAHAGINYLDIDHIFFSHIHPDHTGDLVPFLFASNYALWSPYGSKREKPLTIWGGKGFGNFFKALKGAYGKWINPKGLKVQELGICSKEINDFILTTSKTKHIESSLAYKIEAGGKTIVYSGDTDYSEDLIALSRNSDLLIIECALPDAHKHKGHLIPSEVIEIVNATEVKQVIVTHLYPISDQEGVVDQIRNKVDAQVIEAQDFLQITI